MDHEWTAGIERTLDVGASSAGSLGRGQAPPLQSEFLEWWRGRDSHTEGQAGGCSEADS